MTLGALCLALACLSGLYLFLLPAHNSMTVSASELIRATTLSPIEWRVRRQSRTGWYQRWLRPTVLHIARRLGLQSERIDASFLTQAGLAQDQFDAVELRAVRMLTGLTGVGLGCLLAIFLSGTFTVVPLLGWLGYIAPMRVLSARRKQRQSTVLRELPEFVSMMRAFMTAGLPLERALHVICAGPDTVLKAEIRRALGQYGLGLSIEQALEEVGPRVGVDDLDAFLTALTQSKRSGTGIDSTLRDQELMIRMNQRNRTTAQAAAVSTKLLGVLAGIYLPEFVILIVIPLFWGIMRRAFG